MKTLKECFFYYLYTSANHRKMNVGSILARTRLKMFNKHSDSGTASTY